MPNYAEFALKYQPRGETKVLFIAEAPPNAIDRYFYFEDVLRGDWLWIALIKGLYPMLPWAKTSEERSRKREWLKRFAKSGYRLIDAVKAPMTGNNRQRILEIKKNSAELLVEIKAINPISIVLIKKTVHEALFTTLQAHGYRVINREPLPFPSNGQQIKFHKGLLKLGLS